MAKFALIHLGNEEQYGLLFAASEFKKYGEIRFFDSEMDDGFLIKINDWEPDYACFSLLTVFAKRAEEIIKQLKCKTIVGGHHVLYNDFECDYLIRGTAHNVYPKIGKEKIIINPPLDPNKYPLPSREEYYRDIPRLKTRYRKVMASMFGCRFNCSYCSSSCENVIKQWGMETYKIAYLTHRRIDTLIKEAEFIKGTTQEIEWSDDDLFCGDYEWVESFIKAWKEKINIPIYTQTCSRNILKTPNKIFKEFRSIANCIGMGIQAIQPSSLKLFNRQWDNIELMKAGYNKLKSFGFKVNLQAIVGLPVETPMADAFITLEGLKEIGKGEVVSIYPLQLYSGTKLYQYCLDNKIPLNPKATGDTNSGVPSVLFDETTENFLKNVCKLGTMIVKYNIPSGWYVPLLCCKFNEIVSKKLSMVRYHECINERLGAKGEEIFGDIMKGMRLRY